MVAGTRIRCDVQPQSYRRVDGHAPDDDEWQARWIYAGGFSRMWEKCVDEAGAGGNNSCRGVGGGRPLAKICGEGRRGGELAETNSGKFSVVD